MSRLPIFVRWGIAGTAAGSAVALALTSRRQLSMGVMVALIAAACVTFLVVALATKVVVGREILGFHQHAIAGVLVSAALLSLLNQPVIAYLDPLILGLGACLAVGRLGCLAVGCCHGRPAEWGVRYSSRHVAAGFPRWLVGVPLVPVQPIESAIVAALVAALAASAWSSGAPPGAAAASLLVAYAAVRFVLESLRGDPGRPHLWGVSHAQLTTAVIAAIVVIARPARPAWHVAIVAGLALGVAAKAIGWRLRPARRLLHPRHVAELGAVLSVLAARREDGIPVTATSRGLVVSAGVGSDGAQDHYALSGGSEPLDQRTAKRLARLVVRLRHPGSSPEVIVGERHVLHVAPRLPPPGSKGRGSWSPPFWVSTC